MNEEHIPGGINIMRTVHWIFISFILLLLIPQIYFALNTPEKSTFIGFFFNPADPISYKMWIAQYAVSPFAQNLYEAGGNVLRYFNPFLYIESIAVNAGIDFWIIELFLKIVLFGSYLLVLERFVNLYEKKENVDNIILISVMFSSFLTIVMYESIFLSAYMYALTALHLFLQIMIMNILISGFSTRNAFLLLLSSLFLFLSHPYAIIYLAPIVFLFLLLEARRHTTALLLLGAFALSVIFSIFIYLWEIGGSGQYLAWAQFRFGFDFSFMLIYFLPFSLTAFAGIYLSIINRKFSSNELLLALWVGVVFLIVIITPYLDNLNLPIQPQKFVIGLAVPLILLSYRIPSVAAFVNKYKLHILMVFGLFYFAFVSAAIDKAIEYTYVKNDLISAFESLGKDPGIALVLSSEKNSLISPFYTGKHATPGHYSLVSNFEEKRELSESILKQGDWQSIRGFCRENIDTAIVTEDGEMLYDIVKNSTSKGMQVMGEAAIIYCDLIGKN